MCCEYWGGKKTGCTASRVGTCLVALDKSLPIGKVANWLHVTSMGFAYPRSWEVVKRELK